MLHFTNKLSIAYPETIVSWTDTTTGEITTLSFITAPFGRAAFGTNDVYTELNNYIATLSTDTQKAMFDEYGKIRYNLDNIVSNRELAEYLKINVAAISTNLSVEAVYTWVKFYSNIVVPNGFENNYVHDINNNKTLEKTYLRDDYVYLMALCVVLKAYIPIWGEYINLVRKEVGTDFKEYGAFQLLNKTNYSESIPCHKLTTYINHTVLETEYNNYNIINNISSEDYIYYIYCLTCVKRLPLLEIKTSLNLAEDNGLNALTFIYKYIKQRVKGYSDPKKIVRDKNVSVTIDEGSKISVLEKYKIKSDISLEDIVELGYSVKNPYELVQRLTGNIDLAILDRSIKTSSKLLYTKIPNSSIKLLEWVFKPVISPRGIVYLSKPTLVSLLAALEVVLWVRGYKHLALLVTSEKIVVDEYIQIHSMDNRIKIRPDLVTELERLYPFTKPIRTTKAAKEENRHVLVAIDTLANSISSDTLKMTAHESMITEVFKNNNRKFSVVPEIKTMLAELVVEIGKRSWN